MLRDTPMTSSEANASVKQLKKFALPAAANVPKNISLEEFIKRFIIDWSIKYPTNYVESGAQQTRAGARRSLGDITRLCHHHISEDITIEQVKDVLKKLVREEIISADICSTINKRVFFKREEGEQTYDEMEDRDEFGYTFNPEAKTKRVLSAEEKKALKAKSNVTKKSVVPKRHKQSNR